MIYISHNKLNKFIEIFLLVMNKSGHMGLYYLFIIYLLLLNGNLSTTGLVNITQFSLKILTYPWYVKG